MPDLITSPDQVDDTSQPVVTPQLEDQGTQFTNPTPPIVQPPVAASVSYQGPTDKSHQRAVGMLGDIDRRVSEYDKKDTANTNLEMGQYRQAIQGEKDAIGGLAPVHDQYEQQLQAIDIKKQALYDEAARQTEAARAEAKVSAAQFTNQYQQQLAAIRAMSVNIAGPLAQLSTAESGGVSLALFAQGFLAAQGININVSGQIDKWVDRSIQEQQRQIGQAQQGAQDTLNLWNIARQNSADDLEARQRYRGFIIQGLQSQTEMSAARFQSKLATAQANVSIAHLGTEAQLTETSMAKAHEQRVFEQKKWETQTSFELEKVNLERQRLAIDMMKAQREKAGKPVKQTVITDPSDGKAKWVITDDQLGAEPSATKAKEAAADYGAIDTQIKKAMVARDKLDDPNYGHSIMDNVNSAKREYKAMVNSIAIQTGKTMYGTRQSDKEYERIESLIPFDKWYQKGDNAGIWQNFRENLRSEFDNQMLQHAQAIPGSLQDKTPHNIANPGAAAEYNAKETGAAPVQKFAAAEQAQAVGKDSEDLDETTTGSKLYGHYVKKAGIPVKSGAAGSRANAPVAEGSYSSLSMPGYAVAIDHLATGYADPENIKAWGDKNKLHFGTKNETPDEISQESYKTLLKLASGHINTPEDGKEDVPKEARDYAQYIVSQSKEGLRSLMATDPNKRKDASIDVTGVPNELSLDTRNSSRLQ